MAREYFCAYHSYAKSIRNLSDAECGRLFKALLSYSAGDTLINLQGREGIAFDFITEQIDRDNEAYEAKCAKNRANGERANGTERPRTVPNAPQGKEEGKEKEKDKEEILPPNSPPKGKRLTPPSVEEDLFERFWKAYPKKVGKGAALKAFEKAKVNADLIVVIEKSIEQQKKTDQWKKENGQFIPNPATWLNQQRWEDEVAVKKTDDYDDDWFQKKVEHDMATFNKLFELGNIK